MSEQRVTSPLFKRIAVLFDFDDTLAPATFGNLLDHLNLDRQTIEKKLERMVDSGWRRANAKAYLLIQERKKGATIKREQFEELGRSYSLFDGVPSMFDRLRQYLRDIDGDIDLEFYLLTAGFSSVPIATSIAGEFEKVWGSSLFFDEEGNLDFVKNIITHEDKMHYILKLAKGMQIDKLSDMEDAYLEKPYAEWYIPLDHIIYVGDGASDMSAFNLLRENGGLTLAPAKDGVDHWSAAEEMAEEGRKVHNVSMATFEEDSELMRSLKLAIGSIAKKIQLKELSVGDGAHV